MMLMLRKTPRLHQKDQHMNHSTPNGTMDSYKNNSFFNLPGVLVGFNLKNSESDSVRSPTSPFDIGIFSSNLSSHPRSESERHQKRWNCCKVGLSLVDSLDDETNGPGKVIQSSSRKIVPALVIEGPRPANVGMRDSNVVFEIGEAPFESDKRSLNFGTGFVGSILANEIELLEDYTRVTVYGPNPKVTHIFGDCILEQRNGLLTDFPKKGEDFLKNCYACQKKLDGEDIYMYRGEKAFCSNSCRSKEIEIDEEMEKNENISSETSDMSNSIDEFYKSNLFVTT